MELKIRNPYRVVGDLSCFLRLYCRQPNAYYASPKRNVLNSAVSLAARVWGFRKLTRAAHRFFPVECGDGRGFTARDTNSQYHSIYFDAYRDAYEPDVTSALECFLNAGDVFVDVGSNWGHHTFYAVLEKGASAVAFEPNPIVGDDLARVAGELGVSDRVTLHRAGVSDGEGTLRLSQNYFESGVASIDDSFAAERKSEKLISVCHRVLGLKPIVNEVPVVTLDSLALDRIDLMKVDAEGVELAVFRGGRDTIARLRPRICFEFHSADLSTYDPFERFFADLDYTLYEIAAEKKPSSPGVFDVALSPIAGPSLVAHRQYNIIAMPNEADPPDGAPTPD